MTNTHETSLGQVSDAEHLQEDIQLTELVPVQQSRIKHTRSDKDQNTTDGLKVLRSFTQNDNELELIDETEKHQFFLAENNNKQVDSINDEENNGKVNNRKMGKLKNKDFPKDEIYYFYQDQQMDIDIGGVKKSSGALDNANHANEMLDGKLKQVPRKNKKSLKDKQSQNLLSSKDEEEQDLRLNIDVIIQASYLLDQDDNDNVNVTEKANNNNNNNNNNNQLEEINNDKDKGDSLTDTGEEQLESLKRYNCMMCEAKFKGSGGLRNHYKVVHATGPLYKCDDCGKEFPLKERLKLHVRTHTGFKPYKCAECGKSFARGGQLSQHRRTHSQIKPYQCDLCMGTFTCAANLTLHMKRHNGQKDHTCSICGKGFIRRDALKKHLECLHKDLKTFLCVICNKTFKGHLPQHMRTHAHDRPHACPTCGQKFAQKSQLTVHQRTHTGQRPFRCLVCWQAFAHSTALKLHTRRHTGERPFKCTECNVGFTQLPHWKKHMKCIHKRTKPYSCNNCNNFFKKKNDLESHEKLYHGGDIINDDGTADKIDGENHKNTDYSKYKNMTLERMRLLLAVLLKRISKPERLDELGFGKRLIDEILQDSLISAGKDPIKLGQLNEFQALQKNLETFLKWTVPKEHWETFKKMNKSPEEILETLTTT
ncbi:zinc finger protein 37 homolog [Diachasma alloeum]|uniref:zinc finger protein 37 homolog n=1 Tax=Diachasma alloeum TaxID=454923 RepID=UPI000738176D|nr:zinc finger protein 37 homolog [Diachasma alloeum]